MIANVVMWSTHDEAVLCKSLVLNMYSKSSDKACDMWLMAEPPVT